MTKTVGPLFSLSASGTYREQLVFRTRDGATYVATRPSKLPPRSAGQNSHNQNISDMASSWTDLPPATKDDWDTCGATFGKSGYRLWWEQWIIQGSSPGSPPVSPC